MNRLLAPFAALLLGACASPQILPASRNLDGSPYLSPECRAHIAEVRALVVPTVRVKRDNPILRNKDRDSAAVWVLGVIFIRDDRASWVEEDELLHEKCHHFTYLSTGSPVFHR